MRITPIAKATLAGGGPWDYAADYAMSRGKLVRLHGAFESGRTNGGRFEIRGEEVSGGDAERYLSASKDVIFLTTCSYMLDPLKQALRKRGHPFRNPYRLNRGDWNPLAQRFAA